MGLPPRTPLAVPAVAGQPVRAIDNGRVRAELEAEPLLRRHADGGGRPLLEDLYDGTLRDADRFIGRIREDLGEYDPVVVVHGDHGEAIGERGYFGHGSLHEEIIHVPLVVGNVDDHERIDRPISLRALPRLVEAASRDGPTDWASFTEPYVWSKTRKSALAVRSPAWKFYRRNGDDSFYDLDADPEELSPLAPDSTAIGSLLVDLVTKYETGLEEADRIAQAAAEAFE